MLELKLVPEFPQEIIATDEVGRGPLGGPVVVGAVRLFIEDPEALRGLLRSLRARGIRDSKKLTSEERLKVLRKLGIELGDYRQTRVLSLRGVEISYLTWEMCHETIDKENILAASLRGMKEAAQALSSAKKNQTTVLIDGHMKLRWANKISPWNEVPVIKGDAKSALIGLASMIAKEKRDAYMREMHVLYPQYGFASHFGYPTPKHKQAIKEFGPSPIHRKSFQGVREYVGSTAGAELVH